MRPVLKWLVQPFQSKHFADPCPDSDQCLDFDPRIETLVPSIPLPFNFRHPMLKDFAPFNFCHPLKVWNCSNLLQIDEQATVGWYQDISDLFVTKNLYITHINQSISIRNEMCFAWVSCVPVNVEAKDRRKSLNEAWICQFQRSICLCHNRLIANIDSIWCSESRSKEDLQILPILFKLWKSAREEIKVCELQEVSNSKK